mmetsp:Transcript_22685/g.56177  ORF Transcript_22685/g.56177 Transcript_22685/m.56177 type:complete len:240 (+) Transcript_22685:92-811(+)
MNTANNILRSSAKRISVFSHAAMAPSNRAIMTQLDAVVTNSNTISPALPIHRWNIGRSYSISTSRMENVEDKPSVEVTRTTGGGNDDVTKTPQSPLSSPLTGGAPLRKSKRKKKFIPRKAAVELTEKSRTLFKKLLENSSKDGILLNYNQSSTGEPRMVFSFSFVNKDELDEQDEGVSLEVDEEGNPKSPKDALDDGLQKLYVHHNAFLKVLGATVDVDTEKLTPKLFDKEGFELDANA